jgi:predicted amidophosphoribosyltransferase
VDEPHPPALCPVCAAPVGDTAERCPECGCHLAGIPPRPSAYARAAIWWTAAGFAVIYVIVVAVAALAN